MSSIMDPPEVSGLTRQELARRWAELSSDPVLAGLPYRMELNRWGHVEMTPPASPTHMSRASALVQMLQDLLGNGRAFTECAIATGAGIRVADVVWCSPMYLERHREALAGWAASLPQAPEICIEVLSPSNLPAEMREKAQFYVTAGAREAWLVFSDGRIEVHGPAGVCAESELVPGIVEIGQRLLRL
jgi:Uma2 family endonuclease